MYRIKKNFIMKKYIGLKQNFMIKGTIKDEKNNS